MAIICVEGCMGVGKSTLVGHLQTFADCRAVFENYLDNPFLDEFYRDPEKFAFQTQISFLVSHTEIYENAARNGDRTVILDFHPLKISIFNQISLKNDNELALATKLYNKLTSDLPTPSILIHLVADFDVIMKRVIEREKDRNYSISEDYLWEIRNAYKAFFLSYSGSIIEYDTSNLRKNDLPNFSKRVWNDVRSRLSSRE